MQQLPRRYGNRLVITSMWVRIKEVASNRKGRQKVFERKSIVICIDNKNMKNLYQKYLLLII